VRTRRRASSSPPPTAFQPVPPAMGLGEETSLPPLRHLSSATLSGGFSGTLPISYTTPPLSPRPSDDESRARSASQLGGVASSSPASAPFPSVSFDIKLPLCWLCHAPASPFCSPRMLLRDRLTVTTTVSCQSPAWTFVDRRWCWGHH
jgi:hypothetical protein